MKKRDPKKDAGDEKKFQTEDTLSAKTRYKDLVVRIWPYVVNYKGLLALVVVIVVAHTVIGRILPSVIGWAVDHVIIGNRLDLLVDVCLVYFGLELVRFIFVIIETYFFQVLGQKIIYDLRSDLYTHLQ